MATAIANPEYELACDVADLTHDPLGFVEYAYPWGEGVLDGSAGPRKWQREILAIIGKHLQDPATRHTPCRIAVASGHDIGKSALISMILNWGLSTCEDARARVTANTGGQLYTTTVPEVTKWFKLGLNSHWFNLKSESITAAQAGHEKLWRCDFVTWSETNIVAFQGLHNRKKRLIVVFDEASGIADVVWDAVEGVMLDEDTEIIWIAFGNPTHNTGKFRECFGSQKHRWVNFQIDGRNVEGTNKAEIQKWLDDYGEDSDFFRIKVRGEFPRAGSSQFIASDVVAACRQYRAEGYQALPKVLSVDVARFGDDQTVFLCRQGRKARILEKLRGKDTVFVAERTIHWMEQEAPHGTVIDADGIGAGVIDHIQHRGFGKGLFEFHGGQPANDANAYFNRRAEVWGTMRDWLGAGAEIPDDSELADDLTSPEYGFSNKQQIQLEKKEDMKKRGLSSPDSGDALAMSFSVKIAPPPKKPRAEFEAPGGDNSWMA